MIDQSTAPNLGTPTCIFLAGSVHSCREGSCYLNVLRCARVTRKAIGWSEFFSLELRSDSHCWTYVFRIGWVSYSESPRTLPEGRTPNSDS